MTWRDLAACRNLEPDLFFPHDLRAAYQAVKHCDDCPVRAECRADIEALPANDRHGVQGGRYYRQDDGIVPKAPKPLICQRCKGEFQRKSDNGPKPKLCPECMKVPNVFRCPVCGDQVSGNRRKTCGKQWCQTYHHRRMNRGERG